MPNYEYTCQDCKKRFTLIMSVKEKESKKVACPKCKSKKVEQRMSGFFSKTSRKS